MTNDSLELALWRQIEALKPRVEAARDRAEELGSSSNAYDDGLDEDEPEGTEAYLKVDRFCETVSKADSLAEHLEERLELLQKAASALEDLGCLKRDRAADRRRVGPRKALVVETLPDRYMIDGVSISPGDEFLQTGADNAADNGIYVVTSTGSWERPNR